MRILNFVIEFANLEESREISIACGQVFLCAIVAFFRIALREAIKLYPNTCVMETCKLHDPLSYAFLIGVTLPLTYARNPYIALCLYLIKLLRIILGYFSTFF